MAEAERARLRSRPKSGEAGAFMVRDGPECAARTVGKYARHMVFARRPAVRVAD